MMELIEQRFVRISVLLFMIVAFCSCEEVVQDSTLECLLENIKVDLEGIEIEVGQHNRWTDSTSLILITYHKNSVKIPIGSNLKGKYKGIDIYFYQSTIDSLDKQEYCPIPNGIKWKKFTPEKMEEDYISPPYDPINIQVEYFYDKDCFGKVIRGEGYIDKLSFTICKCD